MTSINLAHLHLLLNHLPIVGIPIAALFLWHSLLKPNPLSRTFAYIVIVCLAFSAVAVYLTGEPAEKLIEHLPGVSESLIESHEDSAFVSMILTLVLGGVALISLLFIRDETKQRKFSYFAFAFVLLATVSLAYTGNLGGKIRHSEIRDDQGPAPTLNHERYALK